MAVWDDAPTILIFGDSEAGLAAASEAAIVNGARIVGALPLDEAADRLDSQIAVDLVVVDIAGDHGSLLDPLACRIAEGARSWRFAAIVTVSADLLDTVAVRFAEERVQLLVGRDRARIARAIAGELITPGLQLSERDDDEDARRRPYNPLLDAFTDEAEAGGYGPLPDGVAALVAENIGSPDPELVRGMIRGRRLRTQFFGNGLFADPAWDILLDLMAARIEGRSVAVSSLCIAAAVPATTALRWIKQLTEMGLLRRAADPLDGRRIFIELTDNAVATMTAYLTALERGGRGG